MVLALFLLAGCTGIAEEETLTHDWSVAMACQAAQREAGWCNDADGVLEIHDLAEIPSLSVSAHSNIVISNVSLTGPAAKLAIDVFACPCRVELQAVEIDGGEGIFITNPQRSRADLDVVVRDTSLTGALRGLNITGATHIDASDVSIDCAEAGIRIRSGTARLAGIDIHGCSKVALDLDGLAAASIEQATIRDGGLGIYWHSSFSGEATLKAVTLRNNWAAALWELGSLSGTHLDIHQNGPSWGADPGIDNAVPGGIRLIATSGHVDRSSFSGNQPVALQSEQPFDGTNNWWGSAIGPTPYATEQQPRVAGGDAASATVQTTPFMQDPPWTRP